MEFVKLLEGLHRFSQRKLRETRNRKILAIFQVLAECVSVLDGSLNKIPSYTRWYWNLWQLKEGVVIYFPVDVVDFTFSKSAPGCSPFFSAPSTFFFALCLLHSSFRRRSGSLSVCSSEAHAEYRPRHLSMSTATYTPGRFHSYPAIFRIRRVYAHPQAPFPQHATLRPPPKNPCFYFDVAAAAAVRRCTVLRSHDYSHCIRLVVGGRGESWKMRKIVKRISKKTKKITKNSLILRDPIIFTR